MLRVYKLYRPAFTISVLFWLVCGGLLSCIALTVVADEQAVQTHVKNCLLAAETDVTRSFEECFQTASGAETKSMERSSSPITGIATPSPLHQQLYQSQS
jgi:hypothetical protein